MNDTYEPPVLTVDSVIFQLLDNKLAVLLIQRTNEPFKDQWALPGGYSAAGETTREAMARVLSAKAGLQVKDLRFIEQLYTFDTVARDPRGHAVSVTYMGLSINLKPLVSENTQKPTFFSLDKLPELAYDHADIVHYALERLRSKITYTNAVHAFLPTSFTLTQLQVAYEAILGHSLDKRNFRKKIGATGLIKPTEKYYQEGAHRPARLYRFKNQTPQESVPIFG